MRGFHRLALAATSALALAGLGCAEISIPGWLEPFPPPHALADVQQRYTQLIRWNEYGRASDFVAEELRGEFLSEAAHLDDVRFTDYELQRLDPADDGRSATAYVQYRAYWMDSSIEARPVVETQRWHYDAASKAWRVRADLGALRTALRQASP